MDVRFPKEIFFAVGQNNRLYHSRGHVKQSLNWKKSDRVFKLDFRVGSWVDVTEEFK